METLDVLHPADVTERRTLADIIFAKIDSAEPSSTAVIKKVQQGVLVATTPVLLLSEI